MKLTRREVVKLGVGAGAAMLVPDRLLRAQAQPLIQRKIPSSGESLPVIGIGTARRYTATEGPEGEAIKAAVRRFNELGGRVIDTAPSYGAAESVVGDVVAGLGIREGLFLATKVNKRGKEAGLAEMEASRTRLKTDVIDLDAVHNLVDTDTQLASLREWKSAGRIRYVGVTTSSDRQYEELEQVMKRETLDFIQVDYALDNRNAADRILPLAADRGMGVMINLPFGRGRLFQAVGTRPLPEWAAEFDCVSWAQFFLKYIVSHPSVTCAIPGMAKVEYVVDNLGAARGRLPDASMRTRMEAFADAL